MLGLKSIRPFKTIGLLSAIGIMLATPLLAAPLANAQNEQLNIAATYMVVDNYQDSGKTVVIIDVELSPVNGNTDGAYVNLFVNGSTTPEAGFLNTPCGYGADHLGRVSNADHGTCELIYYLPTGEDKPDSLTFVIAANGTQHGEGAPMAGYGDTLEITVPVGDLSLVKTVDKSVLPTTGGQVTYTFTVTYKGNQNLRKITIADPTIGQTFVCTDNSGSGYPAGMLPASPAVEESITCTATYTITAAQLAGGSFDNTAKVTAEELDPASPDPSNPNVTGTLEADSDVVTVYAAQLSLEKSVTPSTNLKAGDKVVYSFKVTNSGGSDVVETSIVEDSMLSGTVPIDASQIVIDHCDTSGGIAVTDPESFTVPAGDYVTCYSADYTITAGDVSHGSVTNSATAVGYLLLPSDHGVLPTMPGDPSKPDPSRQVTADDDASLTTLSNYGVTLTEAVAPASANAASASPVPVEVPDPLTFTYTITNSGDSSITGVVLNQTSFTGRNSGYDSSLAGITGALQCKRSAGANVGATFTLGASSTDTLAPGDAVQCTVPIYTTVDADGVAGSVTSAGTVTAQPVPGYDGPDPALSSNATVTALVAPTFVIDDANFTLTKTVNPTALGILPDGSLPVGTTVTYHFVINYSGNMDLSNILITDTKIAATPFTCQASTLAAGDNRTLECDSDPVTVVAGDFDANGQIVNTATVNGDAVRPGHAAPTDTVQATSNPAIVGEAQLTLLKTVTVGGTTNSSITSDLKANDQVTFNFTVTNQGSVNVAKVAIAETAFNGTNGPLTIGNCVVTASTNASLVTGLASGLGNITLQPGGSITCTATYKISQHDVDSEGVENTAQATGTFQQSAGVDTTVKSNTSTATLTILPVPALALNETVTPTYTVAGKTVAYTFTITNTGSETMTGLELHQTGWNGNNAGALTPSDLSTLTCTRDTTSGAAYNMATDELEPFETVVCTGLTYTTNAADVAQGSVTHWAEIWGVPVDPEASPTPAAYGTDFASSATDYLAGLAVTKSVTPASGQAVAVGDVLAYTMTFTDTAGSGGGSLYNVVVTDTFDATMGQVDCGAAGRFTPNASGQFTIPQIAAGTTVTCTVSYTVRQADITAADTAGRLVIGNSVTATGNTESDGTGDDATAGPEAVSNPLIGTATDLGVTAVIDHQNFKPGASLTYTITVTNNGPGLPGAWTVKQTLAGLAGSPAITWSTSDATCTLAGMVLSCTRTTPLQPGQSAVITVTVPTDASQTAPVLADVVLTPTTTDTTPNNTVPTITAYPVLVAVDKQVDIGNGTLVGVGGQLVYQLAITNNSQVPLASVTLTDTFNGAGTLTSVNCGALTSTWAAGVLTLTNPLAAGATANCTATYTVVAGDLTTPGKLALTNQASVVGTCDGNVSDCAAFTVTADSPVVTNPLIGTPTDLDLTVLVEDKSLVGLLPPGTTAYVPETTFVPGDDLSYQITITNMGPGISSGWTLTVPLPLPLTAAQAAAVQSSVVITTITDPSCTVDPVTSPADPSGDMYNLNCTGDTLNYDGETGTGDAVVITYTLPTPPDQIKMIHEPATLVPASPPATLGRNLITGFADAYPDLLDVVKQVTSINRGGATVSPPVREGDVINYQVTVTNDSDTTLYNLTLEDQFNGVGTIPFDSCVLDGATSEPVTGQLVDEFEQDHILVCQVSYTVTAADVAGQNTHPAITNQALAGAWTDPDETEGEQTFALSNMVRTMLMIRVANTGGAVVSGAPAGLAAVLLMVMAGAVLLVRRRLVTP